MRVKVRHWSHFPAGIITGLSGLINSGLPIAGVILFISYEVAQDWRKGTNSYEDIREFAIAFFITLIGVIIWEVLI